MCGGCWVAEEGIRFREMRGMGRGEDVAGISIGGGCVVRRGEEDVEVPHSVRRRMLLMARNPFVSPALSTPVKLRALSVGSLCCSFGLSIVGKSSSRVQRSGRRSRQRIHLGPANAESKEIKIERSCHHFVRVICSRLGVGVGRKPWRRSNDETRRGCVAEDGRHRYRDWRRALFIDPKRDGEATTRTTIPFPLPRLWRRAVHNKTPAVVITATGTPTPRRHRRRRRWRGGEHRRVAVAASGANNNRKAIAFTSIRGIATKTPLPLLGMRRVCWHLRGRRGGHAD